MTAWHSQNVFTKFCLSAYSRKVCSTKIARYTVSVRCIIVPHCTQYQWTDQDVQCNSTSSIQLITISQPQAYMYINYSTSAYQQQSARAVQWWPSMVPIVYYSTALVQCYHGMAKNCFMFCFAQICNHVSTWKRVGLVICESLAHLPSWIIEQFSFNLYYLIFLLGLYW